MPAVTQCYPVTCPSFRKSGFKSGTYETMWHVITDTRGMDGATVMELASKITKSGANIPLPVPGASFDWDVSGIRIVDRGAKALEFNARPASPEISEVVWSVDVTYRPPENAQEQINVGINPLQRSTEYWIEWINVTESVVSGINQQDLRKRKAGTNGPIQNAAYSPVPEIQRSLRVPVFVAQKNVADPGVALELEANFGASINRSKWNTRWRTVAKHFAMFLSAETGRAQLDQGITFYQMQVRVAVGRRPWYERIHNIGYEAWTHPTHGEKRVPRGKIKQEDGTFIDAEIQGPVWLKLDGTLAFEVEETTQVLPDRFKPIVLEYRVDREADYTELNI